MTPRPWHLEPHADGGAFLLGADNFSVGYVERIEDAQLILAALEAFEGRPQSLVPHGREEEG